MHALHFHKEGSKENAASEELSPKRSSLGVDARQYIQLGWAISKFLNFEFS